MFLRCWMKAICGFMMCSTAPRWSTSSPTSLLFVVSGAVRFATSEPQNSGTRGMSRPPCLQTLTLANWPHTIPESRGLSRVSRTADPTSAPLPGCSGSRWSPNPQQKQTGWIWHVYFQNTLGTSKTRLYNSMNISENKFMKIQELWNSSCLCFHHGHLMSSQQHCLSSKFCSCSKARPNKPMLRPEQRAPHLFQIPSNPDLPMIRCTKHIRGPLPGKLTNHSCKVRKCVLGQTSLVKTRQRWAVRNCQEHGIQLVPLETSDLCPSSSAKLSA